MSDGSSRTSTGSTVQIGGPAAVATALRVLDRHVRVLVRHSISQHAISGGDLAAGVGVLHEQLAGHLHAISLEHGTDAMSTAAEYAAASLEAGSLYPGDELEVFLGTVARSVRATSRDLTKRTPFGS
jgi:hypothetical protein